jgi:hypothetical protein
MGGPGVERCRGLSANHWGAFAREARFIAVRQHCASVMAGLLMLALST